MKKFINALLVMLIVFSSCSKKPDIEIKIMNNTKTDRQEITEVSMKYLQEMKKEAFILTDENGKEVPYQITYDSLIVFPATVKANSSVIYKIKAGQPAAVKTIVSGRVYPERLDDVAWENDRIAFRLYGPALQNSGEKAYGYDVWVKNTKDLIVDERYRRQLDRSAQTRLPELHQKDSAAAQLLEDSISYHIDHGNGLDFYKVGPTLGAGTTALLVDDKILYPWGYAKQEILDNGPLRFTVRLTYPPVKIGTDAAVVEKRVITLDAGSQMNKATVSYEGLTKECPIVTGIVLHKDAVQNIDTTAHSMAVAEAPSGQDGRIYVAAVFPRSPLSIQPVPFNEKEKAERGAEGQLLAKNLYKPKSKFVYYFGAGWSKWGFSEPNDWFGFVNNFSTQVQKRLFTIVSYVEK